MKLKNEFSPIREWAHKKGIYEKGDIKTQYIKLQEEAGELAQAIMKNDYNEFVDAIGDCVVVLANLAELGSKHFKKVKGSPKNDITIEGCINSAYDVIKNRQGKMENGTFVKEQDNKKPLLKAKFHKRYFNLPCQHKDILETLNKNDIQIGNRIFTNDDYMLLQLYAKPSLSEGGVAYIYPNDIDK
jgi:hypothetical protein